MVEVEGGVEDCFVEPLAFADVVSTGGDAVNEFADEEVAEPEASASECDSHVHAVQVSIIWKLGFGVWSVITRDKSDKLMGLVLVVLGFNFDVEAELSGEVGAPFALAKDSKQQHN